jgi:hypothetical protein
MEPRNRFQWMNSASLAGRYDNPIITRFLAPIDFLKIPAQSFPETTEKEKEQKIVANRILPSLAKGWFYKSCAAVWQTQKRRAHPCKLVSSVIFRNHIEKEKDQRIVANIILPNSPRFDFITLLPVSRIVSRQKEKTSKLLWTEFIQPTEGWFYNPAPCFSCCFTLQKKVKTRDLLRTEFYPTFQGLGLGRRKL